jgi:hypothetical protein
MGTQQMIHAAVLHGLGQTPRYEPFPAPQRPYGGMALVFALHAARIAPRRPAVVATSTRCGCRAAAILRYLPAAIVEWRWPRCPAVLWTGS